MRVRAVDQLVHNIQEPVGAGQQGAREVLVVIPVAKIAHAVRSGEVGNAFVRREPFGRHGTAGTVVGKEPSFEREPQVVLQVQVRRNTHAVA